MLDGGPCTRRGQYLVLDEAHVFRTEGETHVVVSAWCWLRPTCSGRRAEQTSRRGVCLVLGGAPCVGRSNTRRFECLVVGDAPCAD